MVSRVPGSGRAAARTMMPRSRAALKNGARSLFTWDFPCVGPGCATLSTGISAYRVQTYAGLFQAKALLHRRPISFERDEGGQIGTSKKRVRGALHRHHRTGAHPSPTKRRSPVIRILHEGS